MSKFLKPMKDGNGLSSTGVGNLSDIISNINKVISTGIGIITTGVIILAIFIAFKFFTADDDTKRKNAKSQLIYCIICIVILLALLILAPTVTTAIKDALDEAAV